MTTLGTLGEWAELITKVGNALGLKGRFLVDFGFEQMESKARQLNATPPESQPTQRNSGEGDGDQ